MARPAKLLFTCGVSPAKVSRAGACSGPQREGEIPGAKRGDKSLCYRREQA